MNVTRLVSTENPAPGSVASFTTIRSSCLDTNFPRPCSSGELVSSANPTVTSLSDRAPIVDARMSGVGSSAIDGRRVGLLDLLTRRRRRAKIRRRCSHDQRVCVRDCMLDGSAHLLGRFHERHARPRWRRDRERARDELTSAPRRHAAAAIATPILPLLRFERNLTGSTGSRVGPAVTTTRLPRSAPARLEQTPDVRDDRLGVRQAPGSAPSPTASAPGVRLEHAVADLAQVGDVRLRLRVRPHAIVHCRNDQHRRGRGEQARREQLISVAVRGAGDEVRRRGSDDNGVRGARQLDVIERVPFGDERRVNRAAGERLERDRANELRPRIA